MGFFKNPFKSVVNLFQNPADWTANLGEEIYDATTQTPGKVLGGLTGSEKVERTINPPTWDEWGKPGEAFATDFDEMSGILPPSWRQYAAPAASFALNFIPGVGPLASAAFSTAYNAGKMQQNQKGMDWGSVGRDAFRNFGTAALQMGANKIVNNMKADRSTANLKAGMKEFNFDEPAALASNTIPSTTSSDLKALDAFTASAGDALRPSIWSKVGSKVAEGAVKQAPQAISETLAPKEASPIVGSFEGFSPMSGGSTGEGYQYGDTLKAFMDPSVVRSGSEITPEELNRMTLRVGMNNVMQQNEARDKFLPTGQTLPEPNTPYSSRLSNINTGTEKSYEDLLREADNWNYTQRLMDANPNLTQEQIDEYIANPELLDPTSRQYFQGLQPLSAWTTSMLRE